MLEVPKFETFTTHFWGGWRGDDDKRHTKKGPESSASRVRSVNDRILQKNDDS